MRPIKYLAMFVAGLGLFACNAIISTFGTEMVITRNFNILGLQPVFPHSFAIFLGAAAALSIILLLLVSQKFGVTSLLLHALFSLGGGVALELLSVYRNFTWNHAIVFCIFYAVGYFIILFCMLTLKPMNKEKADQIKKEEKERLRAEKEAEKERLRAEKETEKERLRAEKEAAKHPPVTEPVPEAATHSLLDQDATVEVAEAAEVAEAVEEVVSTAEPEGEVALAAAAHSGPATITLADKAVRDSEEDLPL